MSQLTVEDIQQFRDWLKLDEEALSWNGRYYPEFEAFWTKFFIAEVDISYITNRFHLVLNVLSHGPARSWMEWLREQFLLYLFITTDCSIDDLMRWFKLSLPKVLFILRKSFIETHGSQESRINVIFQKELISDDKKNWKFQKLVSDFELESDVNKYSHFDMRQSYEITLSKVWHKVIDSIIDERFSKRLDINSIPKKRMKTHALSFLKDSLVIILVVISSVFILEKINRVYELHLLEKIKIFEPNFFWLDRNLSFEFRDEETSAVGLASDEIDALEQEEQSQIDRWEIESYEADPEIILFSSTESLFSKADTSISEYEEESKEVIRDRGYGYNKAYRVLLNSPQPLEIRNAINEVLQKYSFKQVDSVKPGTEIPGGVYYNIFVDTKEIEQLLKEITNLDDSSLYVNKTHLANPRGFERVFIWIKSI